MKELVLGQSLTDDRAAEFFNNIKENENTSERYNNTNDDEADLSLLAESGLYKVNFQYDDQIACHIERVA